MLFYAVIVLTILFLLWQVWRLEQLEREYRRKKAQRDKDMEDFLQAWCNSITGETYHIEALQEGTCEKEKIKKADQTT